MAFPTIPFTNMSLRSINPTRITSTINGIEQRASVGAQYYSLTVSFSNLTQAYQRQLFAFVDEMRGPLTNFDIALPDYLGNSTGSYTGSITVNGAVSAGATSVIVATSASNGTVILKAGDLLRFASHNKLYAVKSDITAGSGGAATILLTQPLRSALTNSSSVTHRSLSMNVRFASDNQEFQVDASLYPTFDIEFVEVLQ